MSPSEYDKNNNSCCSRLTGPNTHTHTHISQPLQKAFHPHTRISTRRRRRKHGIPRHASSALSFSPGLGSGDEPPAFLDTLLVLAHTLPESEPDTPTHTHTHTAYLVEAVFSWKFPKSPKIDPQ